MQDPRQVTNTSQEAWNNNFLAVGSQYMHLLHMDGLSIANYLIFTARERNTTLGSVWHSQLGD